MIGDDRHHDKNIEGIRAPMTVNQDMPPHSAGRSPHRPGVRFPAAPQDPLEGEAASRQASVGRGTLRCPLRGLTVGRWGRGPFVGALIGLGLIVVGAGRSPAQKPGVLKSPERLAITVRVDFGPAGKPAREERFLIDRGSTAKDAASLLAPIQSGAICCNTRELAAIDGVWADPAHNLWWTCRINGSTQISPFLTELHAGDRVEWVYVTQSQ